jgi:hypothetical protein
MSSRHVGGSCPSPRRVCGGTIYTLHGQRPRARAWPGHLTQNLRATCLAISGSTSACKKWQMYSLGFASPRPPWGGVGRRGAGWGGPPWRGGGRRGVRWGGPPWGGVGGPPRYSQGWDGMGVGSVWAGAGREGYFNILLDGR